MKRTLKRRLVAWALRGAVAAVPSAAGAEEWFSRPNALDIGLQASFTGLMLVDWAQTQHFVHDRRSGLYETNVFMGQHPTSATINRYQAGCILGHALVAWALPRPWRNAWQMAGIGIEVYAVGKNISNGVRLTVKF